MYFSSRISLLCLKIYTVNYFNIFYAQFGMSLLLGTVIYLTATSQIPLPATSISSAGLSDGNYILTWATQNGNVEAQIFNSEGTYQTEVINVSQQEQVNLPPAVAAWQNGSFVIAWTALAPNQTNIYNIYAQIYNQEGTPNGENFEVNAINFENPAPQGPQIATSENVWMISFCSGEMNCEWYRGENGSIARGNYESNVESSWLSTSVCTWSDGSYLFFLYSNNENIYAVTINSELNQESSQIESIPGYNVTLLHIYTSVSCLPDFSFLVLFGYPNSLYGQRYYQNGSTAGTSFLVTDSTNFELLGFNSEVLQTEAYIITYMNSEGIFASVYNQENVELTFNKEISTLTAEKNGINPLGLAVSQVNNSFSFAILSSNSISLTTFAQTACSVGATGNCPSPNLCNTNNECVQCVSNEECGTSPLFFCNDYLCSTCSVNDCASNSSYPVCGDNGICVGCNVDSDCHNSPYLACNTEISTCVVCMSNSECQSNNTGQFCNVTQNQCVECINNEECGNRPICSLGVCLPCNNNEECPNGEVCCNGDCASSCSTSSSLTWIFIGVGVVGLGIILFFAKKYFTNVQEKDAYIKVEDLKKENPEFLQVRT